MFTLALIARSVISAVTSVLFLVTFGVIRYLAPSVAPRYLRWFLERLGGGFAKLGQMLAMRFDMLPPAYYEELKGIFDRMPRVSRRAIRRVIRRDLHHPVELLFARFDDEPIGSASIAQAHRAELWDGQKVVVKVRRPHIRAVLRADLFNLEILAWLLQVLGWFRNTDLGRIIREVKRYTLEELDFRREAFNAQALHVQMLADDIDHYSPRPYFELCGRAVLTLEQLDGVWVKDLLDAVIRRDHARLAEYAARGASPRRIARLMYRSMLEQLYHHRLFHADPHVGNLVILDGGTLGYIDFGVVGELDEDLRTKQERLLFHLVHGEIHAAYRMLLALIEVNEHRDLSELEIIVKAQFTDYLLRVRTQHARADEKSTGRVFIAVANALRRLALRLPAKLTRFYRAQIIADMLVLQLDPGLDPAAELQVFWRDEGRRRFLERAAAGVDPVALGNALAAAPRIVRELSDLVQFQIPRITQTYGQTVSRFERGFLLGLQYLRAGLALTAFGLLALHLWPGVSVEQLQMIGNHWILWTVAFLLTSYGIGRIALRMRSFD